MSLVENIKLLCDTRGMSIPKLEKELGFGRGSIYNWEKSSPSIDKIKKVADYFNVSINRILYGFDADKFSNLTNIAKGDRTISQFAMDTGIDQNEIIRICLGYAYDKPSIETVRKIASNNQHSILFGEDDFLEAAGYISGRQGDSIRKRIMEELANDFEEVGFNVRFENEDQNEKVYIEHPDHGTVVEMLLHEFVDRGESVLEKLKHKYIENHDIETIAAHHDGEEWTEEELEEIERFKEFVRMRKRMKGGE